MRHALVAGVLGLVLSGGAHAATGGSVTGTVVATPLAVALSLSSSSQPAGASLTATATVSNLGAGALSNVDVTLQADSNIAGASTKRLASLAGGGNGAITWQLCGLVPGSYVLVAKAETGSFTSESAGQVLQITGGSAQCPESAAAIAPAGGIVSTDTEGDGATGSDTIETSVYTPLAGSISIDEQASGPPASPGLTVLGWQVQISAPASTAGTPLRFTFELDASLFATFNPLSIQVSRNGLVVSDCTGAPGTASPDPCVLRRALQSDGDLELVVLTSAASTWTFGTVYPFSGFLAPVDNLPVVNAVKAGQAVPVKFSLGGDRGLAILAAGYPVSQKTACDTGAPIDEIEQTLTASASSLSYDPVAQQYAYVWKTDRTWAGTCRQLVIRLVDGTDHQASFKLR